jgi:hypothetical protein
MSLCDTIRLCCLDKLRCCRLQFVESAGDVEIFGMLKFVTVFAIVPAGAGAEPCTARADCRTC